MAVEVVGGRINAEDAGGLFARKDFGPLGREVNRFVGGCASPEVLAGNGQTGGVARHKVLKFKTDKGRARRPVRRPFASKGKIENSRWSLNRRCNSSILARDRGAKPSGFEVTFETKE